MGKGDKKSRRGKIIMGSYGKRRPQRSPQVVPAKPVVEHPVKKVAKAETKKEEVAAKAVTMEPKEAAEPKQKKTKKVTETPAAEKKKAPKKEKTEEVEPKPKTKKTTKKAAEDSNQQDLFTEGQ